MYCLRVCCALHGPPSMRTVKTNFECFGSEPCITTYVLANNCALRFQEGTFLAVAVSQCPPAACETCEIRATLVVSLPQKPDRWAVSVLSPPAQLVGRHRPMADCWLPGTAPVSCIFRSAMLARSQPSNVFPGTSAFVHSASPLGRRSRRVEQRYYRCRKTAAVAWCLTEQ